MRAWISVLPAAAFAAALAFCAPAAAQPTPLSGADSDYDPLMRAIGEAHFVLLGESTHGSREFYEERARITLRLAREKGFGAVLLEAGFPEIERVNRYVRGEGQDASAAAALADVKRFPAWTWRNAEFAAFVEQLRIHNLAQPAERRVGVYGMDVYRVFESIDAVLAYLEPTDAPAAREARRQYRCLTRHGTIDAYGAAARRPSGSCEAGAKAVLASLTARPAPSERAQRDALFAAVRNAASVAGGEDYYRAQYGGVLSWNVRDRWMARTVQETAAHVGAPVVVWAHNTHVGDARATDMPRRGEINLGQLLREAAPAASFNLGFLTYSGRVLAAREWDAPARVRELRPALPESHAARLRAEGQPRLLLLTKDLPPGWTQPARLQRAVGVIYRPDDERRSHYVEADLAKQFDAIVYIDQTDAVRPLG